MAKESVKILRGKLDVDNLLSQLNAALAEEWLAYYQYWVGALVVEGAMLFLHKAEAAPVGLCKALFGQDVLIDVYPWHAIDPILFALPLSAITIVLVSLATQKKVF